MRTLRQTESAPGVIADPEAHAVVKHCFCKTFWSVKKSLVFFYIVSSASQVKILIIIRIKFAISKQVNNLLSKLFWHHCSQQLIMEPRTFQKKPENFAKIFNSTKKHLFLKYSPSKNKLSLFSQTINNNNNIVQLKIIQNFKFWNENNFLFTLMLTK